MEMNLVKMYLRNRNFGRKDVWVNGLLIEHMRQAHMSFLCHAYYYGKKSLKADKIFPLDRMLEDKELLLNSKMVVFKSKNEYKPMLLNRLNMFCKNINHYGLIVDTFSGEVYFFPKLRYQDGYLIKEIFANKFQNNQIDVLCGSILL